MKKKQWEKKIIEQCQAAGTYQEHYAPTIETLASVLEKRDDAEKQYKDNGGQPLIEYTSDRGSKNMKKNPAIGLIVELNAHALALWRDLGLTPAGLKKLNGEALTVKTTAGFEALLAKIAEE